MSNFIINPYAFAAALSVVSIGATAVNATSFTLNPTTLGAAVGDIMVVFAAWETDTQAITPPASWTENIDQDATESTRRVSIHTIKFAGSVPGDQTWSYAGSAGVAYCWCIIRGATSVGTASYSDGNTNSTVGTDSISVTLSGAVCAIIGMVADGVGTETGETATFSESVQQANSGNTLAGRYSLIGFTQSDGTKSYTTTQFNRDNCGNYLVYVN